MDKARLEQMLAQEHESALGWALHWSEGRREEALDLLQSVYLAVLDGKARFDGRSSFRTWLFAVIRRSALRHRWRNLHFLQFLARVPARDGVAASAADHGIYCGELREKIHGLLKRLSARQREVLHLVFYQDLTIDQAAEVMGIGPGTARTHYERGKSRLLREIRNSGIEHEYAEKRLGSQTAL